MAYQSTGKTYGRRVGESYKDAIARLSAELAEAEAVLARSHQMLEQIGEAAKIAARRADRALAEARDAAEQDRRDAYKEGYERGYVEGQANWEGQL